jgi:nucleotide-binding universal stress UspA family protein
MAISTRVVVVGVDDTQASRDALAFAMSEAAKRTSVLRVVTAYSVAGEGHFAGHAAVPDGALSERARRHAQHVQDRAVALILQQVDARPVLSRQVVEGEPGKVLLRVAKDADYLVVGAASSSSSRLASLGSVSDYCIRNATGAVMLIPSSEAIQHGPGTANRHSAGSQPS